MGCLLFFEENIKPFSFRYPLTQNTVTFILYIFIISRQLFYHVSCLANTFTRKYLWERMNEKNEGKQKVISNHIAIKCMQISDGDK